MTPRIENVLVAGPAMLCVKWKGKGPSINVSLANWIATGGEHLAALTDKEVFCRAAVGNY